MSSNLIQIKAFLGKYYPELAYSSTQDKYAKVGLNKFFEQRFIIQDNKTQMIIDPQLKGLVAIISGNEIFIENKEYTRNVPTIEVNKFRNDCELNNKSGFLLPLTN